jgi:hypothetical protein
MRKSALVVFIVALLATLQCGTSELTQDRWTGALTFRVDGTFYSWGNALVRTWTPDTDASLQPGQRRIRITVMQDGNNMLDLQAVGLENESWSDAIFSCELRLEEISYTSGDGDVILDFMVESESVLSATLKTFKVAQIYNKQDIKEITQGILSIAKP